VKENAQSYTFQFLMLTHIVQTGSDGSKTN